MNPFMRSFNASLAAAAKVMGEPFTHKGIIYEAIAIDEATAGLQVIAGGTMADLSVVLTISGATAAQSGVAENDVLIARGREVRVLTLGEDGSASVTLNCGPAGVAMPGF